MMRILLLFIFSFYITAYSQTTIFTHGYANFDELGPYSGGETAGGYVDLGKKIVQRNGSGTVRFYNATTGQFEVSYTLGSSSFTALIFDWHASSDDFSQGNSEAAGAALYAAMMQGYLNGEFNLDDLHFIGHSRGTVVNSEAIERFLVSGVPVAQVTMLDPHDWGVIYSIVGITTPFIFPNDFEVNSHAGDSGTVVWQGVNYADTYYQMNDESLIENFSDLSGRPVMGSYVSKLFNICHPCVIGWYENTIVDVNSDSGYVFSEIGGNSSNRHPVTGPQKIPYFDFENDGILNGNFSRGPMGITGGSKNPGWWYHGGSGSASFDNSELKLAYNATSKKSDRFYIPRNAIKINFKYKVVSSVPYIGSENLKVKIGNNQVFSVAATTAGGYINQSIDVRVYANSVQTIEFLLENSQLISEVRIDDIKIELEANLGRDTTLCYGTSYTLDAGINAADSYTWSNGASTELISVSEPGTYSVTISYHGRTLQDAVNVNFSPFINIGSDTNICRWTSLTLNVASGYNTYLWDDGQDDLQRVVSDAGTYWVRVSDIRGCSYTDSIHVGVITCVGISENENNNKVQLYPNPANDILNIDFENNYKFKELSIINSLGQEIYKENIQSQTKLLINVANFDRGIYSITFNDDNCYMITKRFILE